MWKYEKYVFPKFVERTNILYPMSLSFLPLFTLYHWLGLPLKIYIQYYDDTLSPVIQYS